MSASREPTRIPAGLIAFAWTLVGVPLLYGLYQTVKTAVSLFTGRPAPDFLYQKSGLDRRPCPDFLYRKSG
jgi:hypothetical protein